MKSTVLSLPILLAITSVPGAADARGEPAARLSVESLRERLRAAQQQIRSVSVTYLSSGYNSGYPKGTFVRQVVTVKAPCYVLRISAHGHDGLDWQDDPLQQWGYVNKSGFCNYNPVNQTYKTTKLAPTSHLFPKMTTSFFFMATGIWPLDSRPPFRPDGRPYVLREVAESKDYRLRPELEGVGGRQCHVLELPGLDRLWLDAERGCSLMARELDDPNNGDLLQRYELDGHSELAPGIWLPHRVRTIQYDTSAPTAEGRRRKVRDGVIEFTDAHVNDIDESAFEFNPPPGALRLDRTGVTVQTNPGGIDHLDRLVDWLIRYDPPKHRRASSFPFSLGLLLIPLGSWVVLGIIRLTRVPRAH